MSLQRHVVEQHFSVMSRKWKIKRKRPSSQHPSKTCIHWPEDFPIGSTTTPKFPSWLFLFQITVYKTDNYKGICRKRESGQIMCVRRPEVEPWPTTQLWDLGLHPLINVNNFDLLKSCNWTTAEISFPSTRGCNSLKLYKTASASSSSPVAATVQQQQQQHNLPLLPFVYFYQESTTSHNAMAKSLKMASSFTTNLVKIRFFSLSHS